MNQPGGASPWTLAPVFVLRHAGLPFDWVESLGAAPAVLAACEEVLDVEDELEALLGEAAAGAVATLAAGGAPPVPQRARETVRRWRAAFDRLAAAHGADLPGLRARLREHAATPSYRDAVFTSNPGMYEGMVTGYLALGEVPDTAKHRRVERQLYTYLQRFCGKNETASAYGPMGYGQVTEGDGFAVERVENPVRRAFLAHWAVTELARAAARDKALAPHVPVRLSLLARRAGDGIEVDGRDEVLRPGPEALRLVDLLQDGPAGFAGLAKAAKVPARAVVEALRPLLAAGALVRSLDVPGEQVDPLPGLRASLCALPASESRDGWLRRLDRLASLCGRFAAAGGDVDARRGVLAELESAFTEITGVPARRGAGAVYADRLVLFEEAASPFRLVVGRDAAARLEAALTPALELSAAFGDQVQRGHRAEMAKIVEEAGGALGFAAYAAKARPEHQEGSRFSPVRPVLVPAGDGEPVRLGADALGEAEPGPRYALPDVCLAMAGPEEAADGTWRVLLARVHHHLLLSSWLATFHPDAGAFDRAAADWLDRDGRDLVALATSRRNKGFYRFPGPRLVFNAADPDGRDDNLSATDCTVELEDGRPVLRDSTGRVRELYPVLNDLTTYPPFAALSPPSVLHAPVRGAYGHLGRVTIGDACYQRERWILDPAALPSGGRGPAALLALRRLARRHGLPRFVFARVEAERKPILVDMASPFAAELLGHLRGDDPEAREVLVEEMYPGPGELWLRDGSGRYTCELRMQLTRSTPAGAASVQSPTYADAR
ncbi:lantibiotic dehydratase [Sphaerisporangium album]|uniref:lantibiotic dehydratase n=1 Tax=Sphaerisporangium album TaxID=509200 RepID=UPI0011C07BDA|nr:lantibiotic dehydratase [Sphaerisporangium album]